MLNWTCRPILSILVATIALNCALLPSGSAQAASSPLPHALFATTAPEGPWTCDDGTTSARIAFAPDGEHLDVEATLTLTGEPGDVSPTVQLHQAGAPDSSLPISGAPTVASADGPPSGPRTLRYVGVLDTAHLRALGPGGGEVSLVVEARIGDDVVQSCTIAVVIPGAAAAIQVTPAPHPAQESQPPAPAASTPPPTAQPGSPPAATQPQTSIVLPGLVAQPAAAEPPPSSTASVSSGGASSGPASAGPGAGPAPQTQSSSAASSSPSRTSGATSPYSAMSPFSSAGVSSYPASGTSTYPSTGMNMSSTASLYAPYLNYSVPSAAPGISGFSSLSAPGVGGGGSYLLTQQPSQPSCTASPIPSLGTSSTMYSGSSPYSYGGGGGSYYGYSYGYSGAGGGSSSYGYGYPYSSYGSPGSVYGYCR